MVSQAFRDAAYVETTDEAAIFLITLAHEDWAGDLHLTDAAGTWSEADQAYVLVVGGITYLSAPIEVIPPGQSEDAPTGRLRVPNVDTRIGAAIDALTGPCAVTLSAALESAPASPIAGPYTGLQLSNVEGDALLFEGELTWPPLANEPWPRNWIRPGQFPVAFR